ncbi:flavin reductase family protein [Sporomusa termitida]|uniref:Flavoredoxin n=1 Tax=Sporomusa termitida TaxID=2377 RepID=A0A517DPX0_9FIRM|nr:flavin reductase family protein [Sporomusa termitida]QDR79400.1 Flavoredoxin [Sporomusa termitida]
MKKSIGAKTFAMPAPVWVVGTYGANGEPNIMTAAWGGICCSTPPCVAVSLQKIRASYDNIIKRKAFTVSIPSKKFISEADFAGMVSGKDADKFAAAGLTAVKSELVDAPYVQEFPLILECKLVHTIEIGLHTQFIGEIVDVKAEEAVLGDNGLPVLGKVDPFSYSPPERLYYGVGQSVGQAYSLGLKFKK